MMNKQTPFVIEPFAMSGHKAGCRCAQCQQVELTPGMAQEAEWGRRGSSSRWGRQSRFRPPPTLRRPSAWRRRRARWPRWGFAAEPFGIEPQGSEQVRWAQNALNQIMGLDLSVTGVLDVATRSALRNFQRAQGLPASGFVGPDTVEALRTALGGQPAGVDDGSADEEEVEIGPITASLTWLPSPSNPKSFLFTRQEATDPKWGGGVYIIVHADTGEILKVGKAMSFVSRLGSYRTGLALPGSSNKKLKVAADKLRFYLGRIDKAIDPFTHVERALTRLLFRSSESLLGSRPVAAQQVAGRVELKNILPTPLKNKLLSAYRAPQGTDKRGQRIEKGRAPYQVHQDNLILEPTSFPSWEIV
jgi:hypothetical protein